MSIGKNAEIRIRGSAVVIRVIVSILQTRIFGRLVSDYLLARISHGYFGATLGFPTPDRDDNTAKVISPAVRQALRPFPITDILQ